MKNSSSPNMTLKGLYEPLIKSYGDFKFLFIIRNFRNLRAISPLGKKLGKFIQEFTKDITRDFSKDFTRCY